MQFISYHMKSNQRLACDDKDLSLMSYCGSTIYSLRPQNPSWVPRHLARREGKREHGGFEVACLIPTHIPLAKLNPWLHLTVREAGKCRLYYRNKLSVIEDPLFSSTLGFGFGSGQVMWPNINLHLKNGGNSICPFLYEQGFGEKYSNIKRLLEEPSGLAFLGKVIVIIPML